MKRLVLILMLMLACKRDDATIDKDDPPTTKKPKKPIVDEKPLKVAVKHRAAHVVCSKADTPSTKVLTYGPRMPIPPGPPCKTKADCTTGKNGRCALGNCTYDGCYEDSDCGKGVCECQQEGARGYFCRAGDCAVDGDCGAGGFCSPTWSTSCGAFSGIIGYYCHTKEDDCTNDDECVKAGAKGYCAYDSEKKHWRCGYGHCVG